MHWIVAGAVTVVVAGLGAALTDVGPWYFALAKPSWQPPDWAFAPAWTLIFVCAMVAAVKGWRAMPTATGRNFVVALFLANAVSNVLWSWLFFGLRRPEWALLEVPVLWVSVLMPMVLLWRRSRTAALLLGVYLAWVTFAAYLNFTVVQLNRPLPLG
jgi:tryptophan-rich sensory protein